MHPDISQFPSRVFYESKIQNGPRMDEVTTQPWHTHVKFGTYKFFNVSQGVEEQSGRSIKNLAECQVALALYNRLCLEFPDFNFDSRIGVVSMYRAQIVELRRHFEKRFGKDIVGRIDFNTVDGFQGQEKDVIILSCVRSGPGLQSVGFLSGSFSPFPFSIIYTSICRYSQNECCINTCKIFSFYSRERTNVGTQQRHMAGNCGRRTIKIGPLTSE